MDKKHAFLLSFLITGLIASNIFLLSSANDSTQQVIISRVIDGDTLELQDKTAIRLKNINTPEKNEYGYEQAKNFLKNFENKTATIEKNGLDKYGRTLAKVYAPEYLNLELVKQGFATKYLLDSDADEFIEAEKFAIDNEKGIWNHSGYYSCFNLKIKEKAISIKNNCKELNLKNWTLREEGRKKYNFQDISLGQITLHLLNGTDNQTALFWQSSPSAKNTFYLLDSQQRLVDYEINY
ncbi:thermonuclease family protein [Candidatus Pacearchaeota archaeon]|nr:thermonuclease family protein [Candidatus Pacearchaeota archaeon]